MELLIDLTNPVEEIAAVINIMLKAYPDKQLEILQAVARKTALHGGPFLG